MRFQRAVAAAIAVALCCFITLTEGGAIHPPHGPEQLTRAAAGSDQCLLASNGGGNVAPSAPLCKTRYTAIPRALLAVVNAVQPPQTASFDVTRAAVVRGPRMVGTVELRL